jgi:hypothetical protein
MISGWVERRNDWCTRLLDGRIMGLDLVHFAIRFDDKNVDDILMELGTIAFSRRLIFGPKNVHVGMDL